LARGTEEVNPPGRGHTMQQEIQDMHIDVEQLAVKCDTLRDVVDSLYYTDDEALADKAIAAYQKANRRYWRLYWRMRDAEIRQAIGY
jgi:hypothetical protein